MPIGPQLPRAALVTFSQPALVLTVLCLFFPGYTIEYKNVASGYTVEKRMKNRDWQQANLTLTAKNKYTVTGLQEGADYEFRVMAVNDAGPSKPSKATQPHTVRDPVCE